MLVIVAPADARRCAVRGPQHAHKDVLFIVYGARARSQQLQLQSNVRNVSSEAQDCDGIRLGGGRDMPLGDVLEHLRGMMKRGTSRKKKGRSLCFRKFTSSKTKKIYGAIIIYNFFDF